MQASDNMMRLNLHYWIDYSSSSMRWCVYTHYRRHLTTRRVCTSSSKSYSILNSNLNHIAIMYLQSNSVGICIRIYAGTQKTLYPFNFRSEAIMTVKLFVVIYGYSHLLWFVMDLKYINSIAYKVDVILLTEQIHIFWEHSSTNAHYKMVMFKGLEKLNNKVVHCKIWEHSWLN